MTAPGGKDAAEKDAHLDSHRDAVADYYGDSGTELYLSSWHPRHLHFGIFKPEDEGFMLEQAQAKYYTPSKYTPDIEKKYDKIFDEALVRMIDTVIKPGEITAESVVADTGCGVGGASLYIAETYGCAVTGFNISDYQMDIARKSAQEAGMEDRVAFRFSDCSRVLDMPDESCDVVMPLECACHFADRKQYLREVMRILKPGGRLVGLDWMARDGMGKADYATHIQPVCDTWTMTSLDSKSSYEAMMAEVGLEVVEFEHLRESTLFNARLLDIIARMMRGRALFQRISDQHYEQLKRFEPLCAAWFAGYFEINRYMARKPA